MQSLTADELRQLFEHEFNAYRADESITSWHARYVEHVQIVQKTDQAWWLEPTFQERLWNDTSIGSIGTGHSVSVADAYTDRALAKRLFEAKSLLAGVPVEQRGPAIQRLYSEIMDWVFPRYTPRRPKSASCAPDGRNISRRYDLPDEESASSEDASAHRRGTKSR
jgi:5-methylcytosine-specific restriction protein B